MYEVVFLEAVTLGSSAGLHR